jgi:acyl-CoA synthetase (AMP-forming)/AMP-acid ligase II
MYPIDLFWKSALRHGDRPAVITGGDSIDYNELSRIIQSRAGRLLSVDPLLGSHVALGAANTPDHLIALLAIFAAGKVWIPLNPRNGTPELQRIIEFSAPGMVLADAEMEARLTPLGIATTPLTTVEPTFSTPVPLPFGPGGQGDRPLDAAQAIKFTGGTTGLPKGVIQTHRVWNTNIVTQIHELGLNNNDRFLVAAPITHGTGTYVMPLLAAGGALVFPDYPDAERMLEAISRHRVTMLFAPATLIMKIAEVQCANPHDLSSLRYVIYGGAPMRADQIREAQAVFGPIICTSYGQTEAPQIITFLPPELMTGERIHSVGRATLMTRIAVLNDAGHPVATGEVGEVAVRGDLVMSGYLNAPEETAKTVVNGWLRTGDSGVIDEEGFLYLRDRIRDVIITGGFNVYPSDVESVLSGHPAVADCAVVGVPDDKWGEAVHAAVVLKPGLMATEAELVALIRTALGPVKTPKAFHFYEALPRSAVAKVLKTKIREDIVSGEVAR